MPPPHPDRLPLQPVPPSTQLQGRVEIQKVRELVKDTVVHQPEPKAMKNKGTLTKPFMQTKGVSCRPHPCHKETQTDSSLEKPVLIPVPVPFYVPVPVKVTIEL